MPRTNDLHNLPAPLQMCGNRNIVSIMQVADALFSESDQQFNAKDIENSDESIDFRMACDAFNLWRMRWRLREEYGETEAEPIVAELRKIVCEKRPYDDDEFGLALEATEDRARFPFGLDPLQYAYLLAQKRPIEVLKHQAKDPLTQEILGLAIHLEQINKKITGKQAVLLPIEQLRTVLKRRKLIVAGAVKRLMSNNLLKETGGKAHTGKAREFHVIAQEGTDYIFKNASRTEPKPHL